jgi:WD40 repeat protein
VSDDKSIGFFAVGQKSAKKIDVIKDAHKRSIYSVSWSHCGGFVATGGADNAITVYRVAIVQEKAEKEEVEEKESTEEKYALNFELIAKVEQAHS